MSPLSHPPASPWREWSTPRGWEIAQDEIDAGAPWDHATAAMAATARRHTDPGCAAGWIVRIYDAGAPSQRRIAALASALEKATARL